MSKHVPTPTHPYNPYYEWPMKPLPGRMVGDVRLVSPPELDALKGVWGEYSCTMPTGLYVGKRWLRNANAFQRTAKPEPEWWIAEVWPDENPEYVNIKWCKLGIDPEAVARIETEKAQEVEKVLIEHADSVVGGLHA